LILTQKEKIYYRRKLHPLSARAARLDVGSAVIFHFISFILCKIHHDKRMNGSTITRRDKKDKNTTMETAE